MDIVKYKKLSSSKYKVFLSNGSSIVLHENIIIKYNLLISKKIEEDMYDIIIKDNNNYLLYDMVLKYINTKMRCEFEIITYLKKKNIDDNLINLIINKLKEEGFIDDRKYIKSYISDKVRLNHYGLNKIRNELISLKIDKNMIDEEIENYDKSDVSNNLLKLIEKKLKSNKNYAGDVLRQRILLEFTNKGYSREEILEILSDKDLSNNHLYEKEYKKLYDKYSKKYSGYELECFINQKLYQKGIKKVQ